MKKPLLVWCALGAAASAVSAQTPPPTTLPPTVTTPPTIPALPAPPKHIPPPGIELSAADRAELTADAAKLRQEIDALPRELAAAPQVLAYLPDVEVLHKAVDWALRYNEFFTPKEVEFARQLLKDGHERAAQLKAGQTPWLEATGLVLRGHRSRLDGSVQPYGLVVPEGARQNTNRVLVWLLGRGEKRTELAFFAERKAKAPDIVPQNTLVVVPYGRFCNATKFAGEVDVFEALAAARRDYKVDAQRIMVGGFSMGGGSAWHLAVHYSGLWCGASPGAGFSETPLFTKALAPGKVPRPPWEQKLWAWYDATGYAGNLFNCPTVAYNGENDGQKQASEAMEPVLAAEGLKLERFIGPQTAHAYHAETKKALTARLEEILGKGREAQPAEIRLTTYTLRYPESAWLRIEGLAQHWERSDVKARFSDAATVTADTKNVTAFSLNGVQPTAVVIDGQRLTKLPKGASLYFAKAKNGWQLSRDDGKLRKRPGLTGPVIDAFMEPFLFVRPTGTPLNAAVGDWVKSEIDYSTTLWRDTYRGDVVAKDDKAISEADIKNNNLVLWGDPSSNAVLAKIIKRLPLQWSKDKLVFRGKTYDAATHAPILIFPNPLNPARYVVLNSGLDFRSDAYGNNALQTPKLPDWAIIDLREPPGPRWPGLVADAGFFNEAWE